jgi:chemotaxis protein methyltransferase CheR
MPAGAVQATLEIDTFKDIAALAHRESGLLLVPEKMLMVQSRLRHRLRALQIDDFCTYASLVCSETGQDELRLMISALTTNVSHFFREPHHFDLLTERLLPIFRQRMASGGRIRIWSAGCSNGQEPYSIAMHLCRAEPALMAADFQILATDIDPQVVAFAARGTYPVGQLVVIPDRDKARFFAPAPADATELTVCDEIKKLISFRELNLLKDWPMRQPFDAIFCRNVVIYFDVETQERLWPRFNAALVREGVFFLGHSERITDVGAFGFATVGPTTYTRIDHPSNRFQY